MAKFQVLLLLALLVAVVCGPRRCEGPQPATPLGALVADGRVVAVEVEGPEGDAPLILELRLRDARNEAAKAPYPVVCHAELAPFEGRR